MTFWCTLDHHFVVLNELFQRLRTAGLTAKPGKCLLAYSNIDCLGHVVGNEELKPDYDKVEAICTAPIPVTKKTVKVIPWFSWVLPEICAQFCSNRVTID